MSVTTLVLLAAATAGVLLTGGALALLARRIHPGLQLTRLWLYYSALVALFLIAVFALVRF